MSKLTEQLREATEKMGVNPGGLGEHAMFVCQHLPSLLAEYEKLEREAEAGKALAQLVDSTLRRMESHVGALSLDIITQEDFKENIVEAIYRGCGDALAAYRDTCEK